MSKEQSISEGFELVINDNGFKQSQLFMTKLDNSILETEEYKWYAKISLAINAKENLSDEEKLHFMAMHRTFLQLL